ncbi:3-oxoacyl-[acyl-carrier-protein] synthase I, chloroplastic-like [Salvia splendens]|uniref:3-oxoacyl-[acyl-carrier-protein] synthase I, chloroplastic-like n=1 Tax=Salvia splendens TaxID=180675 RepID=UPI001C269C2E|nr:3-oxoacyl-[acyl-carrier-protein] synthase I, chloroplastic-like [Salvia splendens]
MWSIMLASPSSTLLTQSTNPKLLFLTTSARNGKKMKAMASSTSPKREIDPKKRIVISGMGLVSVFGSDIDVYYNKLLAAESGITLIDRFDTSDFAVRIAGQIRGFSSDGYIDGKDDRRLDDCWRYCLVAGKRALDDANLGKKAVDTYLGGAASCDAHHITDPHPDGLGVASCMIKSLKDARVDAQEVNYVNAHATSTRARDLPEVKAIKRVFNNTSELKTNSTKSIIGDGLGAAGGLEAIATIKAINTGWLHPTLNQDELEAEVTIDTVPNVKKQHKINVAISNSFGFGGHPSALET